MTLVAAVGEVRLGHNAFQYKRSRGWLDAKIHQGRLTKFTIPGDKRVYISRKELEQLLSLRRAEADE